MKSWALIVLTVCMVFCGCLKVKVTGYRDNAQPKIPAGSSLWVVEDEKASNPLLEREVAGKIGRLLQSKGYTLTYFQQADYAVGFGYGMGQAPADVSGYTDIFGKTHVSSSDQYRRWLGMRVLDLKNGREQKKRIIVWECRSFSVGSSGDLRTVLDYLLDSCMKNFDVDTGRQITYTIPAQPEKQP